MFKRNLVLLKISVCSHSAFLYDIQILPYMWKKICLQKPQYHLVVFGLLCALAELSRAGRFCVWTVLRPPEHLGSQSTIGEEGEQELEPHPGRGPGELGAWVLLDA